LTKKQAEKQQYEIAAIECELRLMAVGALGHAQVDPEEGCDLFSVFEIAGFSKWLAAIYSFWKVSQREQESKYLMHPHNLDEFATFDKAAAYLHRQGARAGGEWKEWKP